jgi:hypothetical protein
LRGTEIGIDEEGEQQVLSSASVSARRYSVEAMYARGDYIKAEFQDDRSGKSEWMWVRVDSDDPQNRVVFSSTRDAAGSELRQNLESRGKPKDALERTVMLIKQAARRSRSATNEKKLRIAASRQFLVLMLARRSLSICCRKARTSVPVRSSVRNAATFFFCLVQDGLENRGCSTAPKRKQVRARIERLSQCLLR